MDAAFLPAATVSYKAEEEGVQVRCAQLDARHTQLRAGTPVRAPSRMPCRARPGLPRVSASLHLAEGHKHQGRRLRSQRAAANRKIRPHCGKQARGALCSTRAFTKSCCACQHCRDLANSVHSQACDQQSCF